MAVLTNFYTALAAYYNEYEEALGENYAVAQQMFETIQTLHDLMDEFILKGRDNELAAALVIYTAMLDLLEVDDDDAARDVTTANLETFFFSVDSGSKKTFQTLTDGDTVTWNIENGYNAKVTLAGDRTLSITNAVSGDSGTLVVIQDAVGGHTLTLPAGSKEIGGAITLSVAANATDIISFLYDGTAYYWNIGNAYA